jgi:dihydroxyacid dehydratase/phosphogluconate dehydratase
VLRGNLCPDGAVIKPAACDPKFHVHTGPALVPGITDPRTVV